MNAQIHMHSEIPDRDPNKEGVERAIREELGEIPWEWHVAILCSRSEGWWALVVNSRRFETTMFLSNPADQESHAIRERLRGRLSGIAVPR